jgi:toxin CcdB
LLLDVQADLLSQMNTRAVVPLLPLGTAPLPARRLNPVFRIGPDDFVMVTQFIAAVPRPALQEIAGNLSRHWDDIANALDMLLRGF